MTCAGNHRQYQRRGKKISVADSCDHALLTAGQTTGSASALMHPHRLTEDTRDFVKSKLQIAAINCPETSLRSMHLGFSSAVMNCNGPGSDPGASPGRRTRGNAMILTSIYPRSRTGKI